MSIVYNSITLLAGAPNTFSLDLNESNPNSSVFDNIIDESFIEFTNSDNNNSDLAIRNKLIFKNGSYIGKTFSRDNQNNISGDVYRNKKFSYEIVFNSRVKPEFYSLNSQSLFEMFQLQSYQTNNITSGTYLRRDSNPVSDDFIIVDFDLLENRSTGSVVNFINNSGVKIGTFQDGTGSRDRNVRFIEDSLNYYWNFGDSFNTSNNERLVSHSYQLSGSYDVTLEAVYRVISASVTLTQRLSQTKTIDYLYNISNGSDYYKVGIKTSINKQLKKLNNEYGFVNPGGGEFTRIQGNLVNDKEIKHNNWYYHCLTVNATSSNNSTLIKSYLYDFETKELSVSEFSQPNNHNVTMFNNSIKVGKDLDGNVCLFRIWNRDLSEEEVSFNTKNSIIENDNIILDLRFEEGFGNFINDFSGRGNDFKLYNWSGSQEVNSENDLYIPEWSSVDLPI